MLSDMGCYDVMSLERIERDGVEEKRKEKKRREKKRRESKKKGREEKKKEWKGRECDKIRYGYGIFSSHAMLSCDVMSYHIM